MRSYIVVECEIYDGKIILPRILNQTDKTKYFLLFFAAVVVCRRRYFLFYRHCELRRRGSKFMHEGMPTLAIHPSYLDIFS